MNFKVKNTLLALCLATSASFGLVTSSARATLVDEGTLSGLQCSGSGVNNSGQVAGTCTNGVGVNVAFVALTPGSEQSLPPLTTGRNCSASIILNNGIIEGSCVDANAVPRPVVWLPPYSSATILPPLAGAIKSGTTAINQNGVSVGVSIDSTATALPVIWLTNSAATPLPVGLLGLASTNCSPSDLSDTSGSAQPIVVGNCPNGSGTSTPLKWTSGLLGYSAALLALPSGAQACAVSEVNQAGQAMGGCYFNASSAPDTVQWSASGVPTVLTTVAGSPVRNVGVDMNASGQIAGIYLTSADFRQPFFWDPTTGTNATAIPPLSGGTRASVSGIGDNGEVVGTSEVASGDGHPYIWTSLAGTVDQGTLGGNNAGISSVSKSGNHITGTSEVVGQKSHAFEQ
jgi:probable HAF family extracellular repeat protein